MKVQDPSSCNVIPSRSLHLVQPTLARLHLVQPKFPLNASGTGCGLVRLLFGGPSSAAAAAAAAAAGVAAVSAAEGDGGAASSLSTGAGECRPD